MACWPRTLAVPANPAVVQLMQPDGTKFNARNRGDERQSWVESEDGRSQRPHRTSISRLSIRTETEL